MSPSCPFLPPSCLRSRRWCWEGGEMWPGAWDALGEGKQLGFKGRAEPPLRQLGPPAQVGSVGAAQTRPGWRGDVSKNWQARSSLGRERERSPSPPAERGAGCNAGAGAGIRALSCTWRGGGGSSASMCMGAPETPTLPGR